MSNWYEHIKKPYTINYLYKDYNLPHYDKPPLGLMPQKIWLEIRWSEISDAIKRYQGAGMPIPAEWLRWGWQVTGMRFKSVMENEEWRIDENICRHG